MHMHVQTVEISVGMREADSEMQIRVCVRTRADQCIILFTTGPPPANMQIVRPT